MAEYNFGSIMNRDFVLELKRMAEDVNVQGKTIQDLVAEGQLTEEQYRNLITTINGLLKSGEIDEYDLTEELREVVNNRVTPSQFERYQKDTAAQKEIDEIRTLIDQFTTPSEANVTQQEIIDARDGNDSLGTNIRNIKKTIGDTFSNLVRNGDFSDWNTGWTTFNARDEIKENHIMRVIGNGTGATPRIMQNLGDHFTGGSKIYVRGDFRVGGNLFKKYGFSVYKEGDSTVSYLRREFPYTWEWNEVDGIITLPEVGTGNLMLQALASFDSATEADGQFFEVDNIVCINLSNIFGVGHEPNVEQIRNLINLYPNNYIAGNIAVADLQRKMMTLKEDVAKHDDQISLERTKKLPVDSNKFIQSRTTIINPYDYTVTDKDSMYIKKLADGEEKIELKSFGGTSFFDFEKSLDLRFFDYIEIVVEVDDINLMGNFQIDFYGTDGGRLTSYNIVPFMQTVPDSSKRVLRVPKDRFLVTTDGDLSLVTNGKIQYTASAESTLSIYEVNVIQNKKGAVYMYFDDATLDQYENAFPIMEKYGLKGTIAVPTGRTDRIDKASWRQLREMQDAGWLVVSHGVDEKSLADITPQEMEYELKKSSEDLFDRGFIFGSKCIVAPQGSWSDNVDAIAKKYFALCRNKTYTTAGRPETAMEYPQSHPRGQFYRSPLDTTTIAECKGWIDYAISTKQEVAIAWHKIVTPTPTDYAWSNTEEFFEEICQYVKSKIDNDELECVTWQDTMLQSMSSKSIDTDGNKYLISTEKGMKELQLPIED